MFHPARAQFYATFGRQAVEHVYHASALAQMLLERLAFGRQAGEDETAIRLDARHRHHAVARVVEVIAITLGERDRGQCAVHAKGPAVVGTGERFGMAFFHLADLVAAVRAAVVEHLAATALVARKDHRLEADHAGDEVAIGGHFALVAHVDPAAAEDAVELVFKHLGVGVHGAVDLVALHQAAVIEREIKGDGHGQKLRRLGGLRLSGKPG